MVQQVFPPIYDRRQDLLSTKRIESVDNELTQVRHTMTAILDLSRVEMETARLVERGSLASWNLFRRDPYRWLLRLDKAGHMALCQLLAARTGERNDPRRVRLTAAG
jgi:hypothetical protein